MTERICHPIKIQILNVIWWRVRRSSTAKWTSKRNGTLSWVPIISCTRVMLVVLAYRRVRILVLTQILWLTKNRWVMACIRTILLETMRTNVDSFSRLLCDYLLDKSISSIIIKFQILFEIRNSEWTFKILKNCGRVKS